MSVKIDTEQVKEDIKELTLTIEILLFIALMIAAPTAVLYSFTDRTLGIALLDTLIFYAVWVFSFYFLMPLKDAITSRYLINDENDA